MDVPQKQTCPQCLKAIDAHARICLFCNFRIRARDAGPLAAPLKFPAVTPPDLPAPEHQIGDSEPQIAATAKVEIPSAEIPQPEKPKIAGRVHLKVSLADDDVPDIPDPDEDPDQRAFVPRPQFTLPQLPPRAPELLSLSERLGNSRILRAALIVALVIGGFASGRLAVRTMLRSGAASPAATIAEATEKDLRATPGGGAATSPSVAKAAEAPQASALPEAMTAPILPTAEEELAEESGHSEASAVSPASVSENIDRPARAPQRANTEPPAIRPERVERQSRSEAWPDDEEYEQWERPVRQVRRTRAVPIDRSLPDLDSRRRGTVRLNLLVGADGRVKEITVVRALSGVTAQVIDAVQQWEFKPATLNGKPVPESFAVVLSF